MNAACENIAKDLKTCTAQNAMGKGNNEQKSNINYHAARLYDRIGGKHHD